jgi:hypothetical protein
MNRRIMTMTIMIRVDNGFGAHSERKHVRMIETIQDCEAIIVRGTGRGAYLAMEQANIRPL